MATPLKSTLRLGAGSGFWGDAMDPAMELLKKEQLDYLCFDFLAELTMALLQRQKTKDPNAGYVADAVAYMKTMMPLAYEKGTRLVSNGGGVNVAAAARQIADRAPLHRQVRRRRPRRLPTQSTLSTTSIHCALKRMGRRKRRPPLPSLRRGLGGRRRPRWVEAAAWLRVRAQPASRRMTRAP